MTKITRRTVIQGTAWATPTILASSLVPAYAASTSCNPAQIGTSTYAGKTGTAQGVTVPITNGGQQVNSYKTTVSAGSYAFTQPTNQAKVLNASYGLSGYVGLNTTSGDPKQSAGAYQLDGNNSSTSNMELVLTQARTAPNQPSTQIVTYTFAQPVYGFSIPVHDLTYVQGSSTTNAMRTYRDQITFSVPVTMSGSTSSNLNATTGSTFYRTSNLASSGNGSTASTLTATYSSLTPITSFSITYTDNLTTFTGWQSIGFGPVSTFCP